MCATGIWAVDPGLTGLAICLATARSRPAVADWEALDGVLPATSASPGSAARIRSAVQYSPACYVYSTIQLSTAGEAAAAPVTSPPVMTSAPIDSAARAPALNFVLLIDFTPVFARSAGPAADDMGRFCAYTGLSTLFL